MEENSEQERDVELLEFSLMKEEIDELIGKLELLKESKEPISFDIDDDNELVINYEEDDE